jgi:ABC-2 type transport system ATP-binding protein
LQKYFSLCKVWFMNETRPAVIETTGLTKRFGDYTAVDALDLRVERGTVMSLLGPNGAGKTTTVRMLATLTKADAERVRRAISLTGQFAALDKNLTTGENLMLMARLRGRGRRDSEAVIETLIERFDLGELRDRLIKTLSGGQRRRVDLAASLIDSPQLLVLDEPTTGLDPRNRQVVWATVKELVAEGVSVLLTTQYLEEADALADHVVLIDRGRKMAEGTPAELKAQVGAQRVDVVAADGEAFEQLVAQLGDQFAISVSTEKRTVSIPAPRETIDLAAVANAVHETGLAVDEVALRRPTLDDAFLALTGQASHIEDESEEDGNE